MTKTFKQKLIAVALGLILAVFTSYVSAMSRPSTLSSNPDTFIGIGPTTGYDSQVKDGVLNAVGLLVGNYNSGAYTTINSQGKMSIGSSVTGSALSINNTNTTFNNSLFGSIRSTALAWTGSGAVSSHLVCADANGKLILCNNDGNREFGLGGAGDQTIYDSFIVPPGVSSITVQVIGGGGAGYGFSNSEGTGIDDGDESYFIGNGVSLIATGGSGAYGSFDSGGTLYVGAKGTASNSGSMSSVTKIDGEDGIASSHSASLTNYSTHSNAPINCGGINFYPVIGGLGDLGGNGGKAGNGSQASGGASGPHGPLSSQDYNISGYSSWTFLNSTACSFFANMTSDMLPPTNIPASVRFHRKGGDGSNGVKGGGGAGFGGRGGASSFLDNANGCDTLVNTSPNDPDFDCNGKVAAPGGGGGGYVQATMTVTPGQVFYLKMGRGGVPQNNISCSGANCDLKQPGGGAISGKGGDGYIKITY